MIINNKSRKTRMTSQRLKIIEYLRGVKTHPTAEVVYRAVKKDLPAITLSTVYRNLHLLADNGQILRFNINNEYRFDYDTGIHQHFVCEECGRVFDVHDKNICEYAMEKIRSDMFNPKSVRVIFYGTCKDCGKASRKDERYDKDK
jgi:Fe2+ or Zn2+ uptake regulation protein